MRIKNLHLLKTIAILFFFSIFAQACVMEKGFIYYPEKKIIATPADVGLPFEDLTLSSEDGVQINGWYTPSKGSERALLWFHGNAGNIGNRVSLLQHLHDKLKLNILIIDYRGYGRSGGKVSEKGTARDARAAYDYLLSRAEINPRQIFIFGRSLGAAIAVELAAESPPAGLILEAPFTSIKAMAQVTLPWLPFKGLIRTKYNSLKTIKTIHSPLLLMHGDQDKVIPIEQGQALFKAANAPKTFYTIKGADHNNAYIVDGPSYFKTMQQFIEGLT